MHVRLRKIEKHHADHKVAAEHRGETMNTSGVPDHGEEAFSNFFQQPQQQYPGLQSHSGDLLEVVYFSVFASVRTTSKRGFRDYEAAQNQ